MASLRDESAFETTLSRHDGVDVVAARGELDLGTSTRLRSVLFDRVLCTQPVLVVDLNAVTFMDSTGLGTLVAARRWTNARGARMVLVADDGPVLALLKLTRMHLVMQTWPSVEVVLAELTGRRSP